MPTLTLLAKVYADSQLKFFRNYLKMTLKGLMFEANVKGITNRGWIQLDISGEDEKVAVRYLTEEIGFCPTHMENVDKFATINGRITTLDRSKEELCVDIGVFSPKIVDASISLQRLQAQLTDGRKVALEKITELFGFCENMPLTVKIVSVDKEKNHIVAMPAERQLRQWRDWTTSLLDRLIILGASLYEVRKALKIARSYRDAANIERLGLFEYAIVCKLGTDATGLIPKIGKNLRNATFSIFNPRKITKFLET